MTDEMFDVYLEKLEARRKKRQHRGLIKFTMTLLMNISMRCKRFGVKQKSMSAKLK